MPTQSGARRWTVEAVHALPDDGNRYELVDGELLVTPAPSWTHQRGVSALFRAIHPYVARHEIGEVVLSPADVHLGPDTMVQPDLLVARSDPHAPAGDWRALGPLTLAIEIVSPGSAHADRFRKRLLYQRSGIPEYWIVDLDARGVERWRPGDERPEVLDARLEWQPRDDAPPLVLDLEAVFREVTGG